MQASLTLPPHDPTYVETRGGAELWSHLRGAPGRVQYRCRAMERAFERFATAEQGGSPEAEIGGLGLIVLQRALLAVEDLGGLLFALDGPEPWSRLRSYSLADITAVFERCLSDGDASLERIFRLATDEEIASQDLTSEQIELLQGVRAQVGRQWLSLVRRGAELWTGSPVAKATMHGFPIVAGDELFGPPPAGVLAQTLAERPPGRFAAALRSTSSSTSRVHTEVIPVPLDRTSVERFRHEGEASANLYGQVCAMYATSTELQMKALVPWGVLDELSDAQLAALEPLRGDRRGQQ
jgi:hypothetical protein